VMTARRPRVQNRNGLVRDATRAELVVHRHAQGGKRRWLDEAFAATARD
jgi:hypothetical protein